MAMDWWHWTDGSIKHSKNKHTRYLKDSNDNYYHYIILGVVIIGTS